MYKADKTNKQGYEAEMSKIDAVKAEQSKIYALRERLNRWLTYNDLSQEGQRLLIQVIFRGVAVQKDGDDFMVIGVHHDGSTVECKIGRRCPNWTAADGQQLVDLVESGATSLQIARTFPNRSWSTLKSKAYH